MGGGPPRKGDLATSPRARSKTMKRAKEPGKRVIYIQPRVRARWIATAPVIRPHSEGHILSSTPALHILARGSTQDTPPSPSSFPLLRPSVSFVLPSPSLSSSPPPFPFLPLPSATIVTPIPIPVVAASSTGGPVRRSPENAAPGWLPRFTAPTRQLSRRGQPNEKGNSDQLKSGMTKRSRDREVRGLHSASNP